MASTSSANENPPRNICLLPPCRVCGEKSSGFHYGANTCEPCKAFFRRARKRTKKFRCHGVREGSCRLDVPLSPDRSLCPRCRYLKCLAVGMSDKAIHKGRYTLEKKSRNILEVKKLEQEEKEKRKKFESETSQDISKNLDEIIKELTIAYEKYAVLSKDIQQNRQQVIDRFMESKELREEFFGPMSSFACVTDDELLEFGKTNIMNEEMLPNMERSTRKMVGFSKCIPGFKELHIEDQVKLVKGGIRMNIFMMMANEAVDPVRGVIFSPRAEVIEKSEMKLVVGEENVEKLFAIAKRIHQTVRDKTELLLLQAISILNSDRHEMHDNDLVEKVQGRLIECLEYHVKKSYPEDKTRLARLLVLIYDVAILRNIHAMVISQIMKRPNIKIPPLIIELFS